MRERGKGIVEGKIRNYSNFENSGQVHKYKNIDEL
jgi:hypothetical protein